MKSSIIKSVLCSFFLILPAISIHAAEQPIAPTSTPTTPKPSLLKTDPALAPQQAAPKELLKPVVVSRIGLVDLNKISGESIMGKAAQKQIKGLQAKLQKQVETKKSQIEKFKADVERQMPNLTPEQKQAKSKQFQKKVEDFQKFGMNAEKELMATQEKLTKGMFEAIGKSAEELGKAKGLTAIVVNRELLFLGAGVEPVDISAELLKILDEKTTDKK